MYCCRFDVVYGLVLIYVLFKSNQHVFSLAQISLEIVLLHFPNSGSRQRQQTYGRVLYKTWQPTYFLGLLGLLPTVFSC